MNFLGLGFGNEEVNWDWNCLTLQYWEFLFFRHRDWDFDYFSADGWDQYSPLGPSLDFLH